MEREIHQVTCLSLSLVTFTPFFANALVTSKRDSKVEIHDRHLLATNWMTRRRVNSHVQKGFILSQHGCKALITVIIVTLIATGEARGCYDDSYHHSHHRRRRRHHHHVRQARIPSIATAERHIRVLNLESRSAPKRTRSTPLSSQSSSSS